MSIILVQCHNYTQSTSAVFSLFLIQDALIISHTSVNSGPPQVGGIKTPNTPRLTVSNVTFANFDLPTTSCLRACSHCKVRQGGFQVWFEGLSFVGGSANHKTAFQWEWEVCIHRTYHIASNSLVQIFIRTTHLNIS